MCCIPQCARDCVAAADEGSELFRHPLRHAGDVTNNQTVLPLRPATQRAWRCSMEDRRVKAVVRNLPDYFGNFHQPLKVQNELSVLEYCG